MILSSMSFFKDNLMFYIILSFYTFLNFVKASWNIIIRITLAVSYKIVDLSDLLAYYLAHLPKFIPIWISQIYTDTKQVI